MERKGSIPKNGSDFKAKNEVKTISVEELLRPKDILWENKKIGHGSTIITTNPSKWEY